MPFLDSPHPLPSPPTKTRDSQTSQKDGRSNQSPLSLSLAHALHAAIPASISVGMLQLSENRMVYNWRAVVAVAGKIGFT